jgi:hypothetical protein
MRYGTMLTLLTLATLALWTVIILITVWIMP